MERMYQQVLRACRSVLAGIVSQRPVPRHIGFIMDGNRRYAEYKGIDRCKGHTEGYGTLLDSLQWCLELGVSFVSVYAFSIDNYNRSASEVETLMNLAEDKLLELVEQENKLRERGIRVQVIGDLSLAPERIQKAAQQIADVTKYNCACTLNICFSYTYVV